MKPVDRVQATLSRPATTGRATHTHERRCRSSRQTAGPASPAKATARTITHSGAITRERTITLAAMDARRSIVGPRSAGRWRRVMTDAVMAIAAAISSPLGFTVAAKYRTLGVVVSSTTVVVTAGRLDHSAAVMPHARNREAQRAANTCAARTATSGWSRLVAHPTAR